MSEWRQTDGQGQPVYDDDRLLALALGLDEDPELEAAAGRDDALRRRLDEMRADVAAVRGQLDVSVPAPGQGYADPADPRWGGLREYFEPGPTKATRGAARRWLRVLAPAVAAAVAVAVGVGLIVNQSGPSFTTSDRAGSAASVESRQPSAAFGAKEDGQGWSSTSGEQKELETQSSRSLAKQAERYAIVVVARAARVVGGVQRFTVVRELKGRAPDVLRLGVVTKAAKPGALHVLFLDPLPKTSPTPSPSLGSSSTGAAPAPEPATSPSPGETSVAGGPASPGASATPGHERATPALRPPLAFRYAGYKAVVRRLPAGLDISTLRLP